jgi:hypothetical protein
VGVNTFVISLLGVKGRNQDVGPCKLHALTTLEDGEIRWEHPPISSIIINKTAFLYILFYMNILYFMPSF